MAKWVITKYDGNSVVGEWSMPGHMERSEIEVVLQRLVCTTLNPQEVIASSLRSGSPERAGLLDRVGHGVPIDYGTNPRFTAELQS